VTIHVKSKERTGGDNGKYLIFTDGEVFEDVDAWLNAKTNSSDIYGDITPGADLPLHRERLALQPVLVVSEHPPLRRGGRWLRPATWAISIAPPARATGPASRAPWGTATSVRSS
jgi:hypothetical protein